MSMPPKKRPASAQSPSSGSPIKNGRKKIATAIAPDNGKTPTTTRRSIPASRKNVGAVPAPKAPKPSTSKSSTKAAGLSVPQAPRPSSNISMRSVSPSATSAPLIGAKRVNIGMQARSSAPAPLSTTSSTGFTIAGTNESASRPPSALSTNLPPPPSPTPSLASILPPAIDVDTAAAQLVVEAAEVEGAKKGKAKGTSTKATTTKLAEREISPDMQQQLAAALQGDLILGTEANHASNYMFAMTAAHTARAGEFAILQFVPLMINAQCNMERLRLEYHNLATAAYNTGITPPPPPAVNGPSEAFLAFIENSVQEIISTNDNDENSEPVRIWEAFHIPSVSGAVAPSSGQQHPRDGAVHQHHDIEGAQGPQQHHRGTVHQQHGGQIPPPLQREAQHRGAVRQQHDIEGAQGPQQHHRGAIHQQHGGQIPPPLQREAQHRGAVRQQHDIEGAQGPQQHHRGAIHQQHDVDGGQIPAQAQHGGQNPAHHQQREVQQSDAHQQHHQHRGQNSAQRREVQQQQQPNAQQQQQYRGQNPAYRREVQQPDIRQQHRGAVHHQQQERGGNDDEDQQQQHSRTPEEPADDDMTHKEDELGYEEEEDEEQPVHYQPAQQQSVQQTPLSDDEYWQ
ncbi:hypothetical protein C8R43DRAFT_1121509 [Mycena crocata]|nr:hypothetical protein C8R43DRAFT_1121509 [Mycena crocata]